MERHLGLAYSGPLLTRPVHEITTVEVASLLRPIWRTKPKSPESYTQRSDASSSTPASCSVTSTPSSCRTIPPGGQI
jgi:hypothetical protein